MTKKAIISFDSGNKAVQKIITEAIYNSALERIEELLPQVSDKTAKSDRNAIELKTMSDIVIEYEEFQFPIGNPSL